jgi:hypothetical protein
MFDTSGGGGDFFLVIDWLQIQAHNNAIWMDTPAHPYFVWNAAIPQFTSFGENFTNSNWGTKDMSG